MIRRILIVEPDPEVARDIFLLFHFEYGRFERERYEPEIAKSVARAVEEVQNRNFHCIIMDVNLPEMKGYEAIPLMKTINDNPPIIMTANKNTLDLETKVREQDVYYYHLRSFGQNELRLAVNSLFEESRRVKRGRKLYKGAAKPILLKQLRLFQKEEKRAVVISAGAKLNTSYR